MDDETFIITTDKWLIEHGWLDPTDRQIIAEASQNGQLKVNIINPEEMLTLMKEKEPEKFKDFQSHWERLSGKVLTWDELIDLASKGNETMKEFKTTVEKMDLGQASQIRAWRCETHMTWRTIARAAWREKWFDRKWEPSSNQLMGLALSEKAAQLYGENYRTPPWN